MQKGIQISPQTACGLTTLISDIGTIDGRAGCSDKYFRQHFMLVVNTLKDTGIAQELEKALSSPDPASPMIEPEKPKKNKAKVDEAAE